MKRFPQDSAKWNLKKTEKIAGGDSEKGYPLPFLEEKAMYNILVVDDEEMIRRLIAKYAAFILNSRRQGRFDRPGLFHDFLEHKMLIAPFFGGFDIPCDTASRLWDRSPGTIVDRNILWCQFRQFSVIQI